MIIDSHVGLIYSISFLGSQPILFKITGIAKIKDLYMVFTFYFLSSKDFNLAYSSYNLFLILE